jgi:hypothetical protein
MSFLSSLMKIGGAVAAPFTGGASLALTAGGGLLDKVGSAGTVLGGQQGGANNARVAQGQLDLSRDRNAIDLYGSQQGAQNTAAQLDLQRKGFETNDRSATAKQALIGALLSGKIDPTSFAGGKASGGLLRALQANPEALSAMQRMGGSAGQAQVKPLEFTGGQMVAPPTLSAPQKIDTGGGAMGTIAKIAQVIGALSGNRREDQ